MYILYLIFIYITYLLYILYIRRYLCCHRRPSVQNDRKRCKYIFCAPHYFIPSHPVFLIYFTYFLYTRNRLFFFFFFNFPSCPSTSIDNIIRTYENVYESIKIKTVTVYTCTWWYVYRQELTPFTSLHYIYCDYRYLNI